MAFPHPAIKAYYRARGDRMPPFDKPSLGRCPWQLYNWKPYHPHPAIRAAIEAAHRADTAECWTCGNTFPVDQGVVLRGRFYCRAAVPSFDPVVRLVNSDAAAPSPPSLESCPCPACHTLRRHERAARA